MSATLRQAEQLIARPSVTPDDAGCQALIAGRLGARAFACTALPFGPQGERVSNHSMQSTPASLKARVDLLLRKHELDFQTAWTLGGEPFLTPPGTLSNALAEAIREHAGLSPALSTSGGTSDGRFIRTICAEVIEFGPVNESIHKIDECVDVASLDVLKDVYRGALERLVA